MGESTLAPSKQAGETIEAEVLQVVPELRYVDSTNSWHDARVEELLVPRDELPFGGIVVLEEGTPVEIKAAQHRLNSGSRRGRLQFRKGQHVRLLEAGGSYLLVVYDPQEMRILAMIVIPASLVDEQLPDGKWTSVDRDSQPYCQRSWSRFIAPPTVTEAT